MSFFRDLSTKIRKIQLKRAKEKEFKAFIKLIRAIQARDDCTLYSAVRTANHYASHKEDGSPSMSLKIVRG